ncbi:unnamed protein product [Rhizophagus irregularis]|nr:unnamed protein product [Rhizophagus irregularis]
MPQIQLHELLLNIPEDNIQKIWEVSYVSIISTSKPHYVVVFTDYTSLCTCMLIINQGMPFEPSAETIVKIIISQGIQSDLLPLHHIERLRISNVYTETVRETVNKKIQFGTAISVAKTGVQIAVSENATAELIGILTQFIMKYRNNNGLGVKEIHHEIRQPLSDLNSISEIANPEYHRTKGRPPKRYKSSVEINTSKSTTSVKTCSYCLGRGHNIRGCAKYKLDKKNQISV